MPLEIHNIVLYKCCFFVFFSFLFLKQKFKYISLSVQTIHNSHTWNIVKYNRNVNNDNRCWLLSFKWINSLLLFNIVLYTIFFEMFQLFLIYSLHVVIINEMKRIALHYYFYSHFTKLIKQQEILKKKIESKYL